MDTYPVTARTVGRSYGIEGDKLGRAYKEHLSDFRTWDQAYHADEWMLLAKNVGARMSIDETQLHDDLFTILSNKDGHGGTGTVAAVAAGTSAEEVLKTLMQIPEEKRLAVEEITMDFSESMRSIAVSAFPNAMRVIDCFHVVKRLGDGLEEMRLKEKRLAVAEQKRLERQHRAKLKRNAQHRKWYRKSHPKNYKGKKRGRKPQRNNKRFVPPTFENGDTRVELLTRSKYLICKSPDKWSDRQKKRSEILFKEYPKLKEAYWLVNKLRAIFRSDIDKETARTKFHGWYDEVAKCTSRELKAARDTIKFREDEVLNYFVNRSTNAAAESLNSKLKGFRSQLRGVADLAFYMYRVKVLFG